MIAHDPADADPAGIGQPLQPRRDIDAIAEDVVSVDDDVTDVDTDAKLDPLLGGHLGIALGHATLHVDRAADRVDHTGKFQQQAVARGLDDAATVLSDRRVKEFLPMRLQSGQCGTVVATHEQGVTHHIG